MPWIAPVIEQPHEPGLLPERAGLEAWLDFHRTVLLFKCSGLTGEQLCLRSVEPSTLSLLGLVRHMAEVERSWFRRRLLGEDVPYLYYVPDVHDDGDFDLVDPAKAEADYTLLLEEIEICRAAAASKQLEDTFFHKHYQVEMDLRWVYVHMIEEYARHNGHADLLRERVDGATEK